jgi:hypothetical protein
MSKFVERLYHWLKKAILAVLASQSMFPTVRYFARGIRLSLQTRARQYSICAKVGKITCVLHLRKVLI